MQRISFSKLSLYLIGNPRQSYYHYSTSPITTLFSLTPVSLLAGSSLNLISFPPPYIIALTVTNNQQIIRFSIYLFVFSSCPTFLCFSYFPAFFDIFYVFSTTFLLLRLLFPQLSYPILFAFFLLTLCSLQQPT